MGILNDDHKKSIEIDFLFLNSNTDSAIKVVDDITGKSIDIQGFYRWPNLKRTLLRFHLKLRFYDGFETKK